MVELAKKVAYCPRCDNPYLGDTKAIAMALMMEHWKKAHPDHYAKEHDLV